MAQDSLSHKGASSISAVRQTLDATNKKKDQTSDLTSIADTIETPSLDSLKAKQKIDSLKNITADKKSKINSITDSLQQLLNLPQQKINQATTAVQSRADGITQQLNQPVDQLNNELADRQQAIQTKVDGVENKVQGQINGVENKVQDGINNAENKAQQTVTKVTDGEMKVPGNALGIQKPDAKWPTDKRDIKNSLGENAGINVDATNSNVPKVGMPGTDQLKLPNANVDLGNLTQKANIDVPQTENLGNLSKEVTQIEGKLGEAQQYEDELGDIRENGLRNTEKLPQELEKNIGKMDEMKALNAGTGKMAEYENLIQRYRDKKLLQQEIMRKSKLVANEKLTTFSPDIKNAQETLAKTSKLSHVRKFRDIFKGVENEMSGKPFKVRFVPGSTLQVYGGQKVTADWAIQAGYRISGRFTIGGGYTYRLSFSKLNTNWIGSEGISGYRIYSDLGLIKNFFIHGEFESLKITPPKTPLLLETYAGRLYGSYFGLGRRYNISRKVKGSVMGLYHIDYAGEVPGLNKINLRIGFDYDLSSQSRSAVTKRLENKAALIRKD
jgi:hypothetical protein